MAEAGFNLVPTSFFAAAPIRRFTALSNFPGWRNLLLTSALHMPAPRGPVAAKPKELIKMNSMNTTKTIAAMPITGLRIKLPLAAAALVLALLAMPHAGHAQGVVGGMEGGAQQGEREGGRAAGPVGAVVGGAVGAGVGGAVGAVNGVLGIGGYRYHRHYRHHHHYH
jgi:hypothetical protein